MPFRLMNRNNSNRQNVDTAIAAIIDTGGNRIRKLIYQCEAIQVEIIVDLQNESSPIPLTTHVLMPGPMLELFADVTCARRTRMSRNATASQNYSVHLSDVSSTDGLIIPQYRS